MSQKDAPPTLSTDETADRIRTLQQEIDERDEKIAGLVDDLMAIKRANPPEPLREFVAAMENSESYETVRHLLKIKDDWDVLYTRICAYNEDDEEFLDELVAFIGDLLLEQPEGIDERWTSNLEEFIDGQRAKVS